MVSITKVVGMLSCGVLLCVGLSNGARANNESLSEDGMNAIQSEREGGQAGHKGEDEKLSGVPVPSQPGRKEGQAGLKGDQAKLRGLKSSRMIKGEVLSVESDAIYLQKQDGTAVRVQTDHTTRQTGNVYLGARVEAEVNSEGHALSIRSARSTDRRNEADRG